MENEDFLEFLNYIGDIFEVVPDRIPKRSIRDTQNPLEFYTDAGFRMRYRFSKYTVVNAILPLVSERLGKTNNRQYCSW